MDKPYPTLTVHLANRIWVYETLLCKSLGIQMFTVIPDMYLGSEFLFMSPTCKDRVWLGKSK